MPAVGFVHTIKHGPFQEKVDKNALEINDPRFWNSPQVLKVFIALPHHIYKVVSRAAGMLDPLIVEKGLAAYNTAGLNFGIQQFAMKTSQCFTMVFGHKPGLPAAGRPVVTRTHDGGVMIKQLPCSLAYTGAVVLCRHGKLERGGVAWSETLRERAYAVDWNFIYKFNPFHG